MSAALVVASLSRDPLRVGHVTGRCGPRVSGELNRRSLWKGVFFSRACLTIDGASAKTEDLTAYLPWPFHAVLNSTVSSRPIDKKTAVFGLCSSCRVCRAGCTQTQRRERRRTASTAGERIKDAGDRREQMVRISPRFTTTSSTCRAVCVLSAVRRSGCARHVILILLVPRLDVASVAGRFRPNTPIRTIGGYSVFVGVGLSFVWMVIRGAYVFAGRPTPVEPEAFKIGAALDLSLMVPALTFGGVLLWNRRPWGYVLDSIAGIQAALYLIVLSVNSFVATRRGLTTAPGE